MKGEELLRKQLLAMNDWQLRRLIEAHALADTGSDLILAMGRAELADSIITAVHDRLAREYNGVR